jgi:hypothetical protein
VKFLIDNWMLISVAIATGFLLFLPTLKAAGASGISPNETVMMINRQKAVVIDVCSLEEFAQGHITGSKNIPADKITEQLAVVVSDKAKPIVMVCASGVRSKVAMVSAQKLGFTQVQCLNGGLKAWKEANLPVEKV